MSSEKEAKSTSPQTPAAALLFQAPEFQAPAFQAPERVEKVAEPRAVGVDSGDARSERTPSKRGGSQTKGTQGSGRNKSADEQDDSSRGGKAKGSAKAESTSAEGQQPAKQAQKSKRQGAQGARKKSDDSSAGDSAEVEEGTSPETPPSEGASDQSSSSSRRRRRRTRSDGADAPESSDADQVQSIKGSTRLEAKRMRRREGRKEGRRRHSITEAEFLARRESVDRQMIVRHEKGSDQVAVLEDGILVEHFVARRTNQSIVGNIYLGKVQNVLPSMEAAFIDVGRGRNAVLYAGEVNWDSLGMQGKPRRIETALSAGDNVLVQVTKDPIGHKGARLTSQITLAGRYLVLVPGSTVLGISRKLPDPERNRLKKILKEVVPEGTGVIVRTASEGASEEQLRDDVERLTKQWDKIEKKVATTRKAPVLLRGEPEMVVRVVRDLFNEDVTRLTVQGEETWQTVHEYVEELSPELLDRLEKWTSKDDVFAERDIKAQLAKGMDRKVWLPSGGTLIIERTEAMTVVDVNTGKFIGSGGTLEETVTRNNLEAAEEIVRQLRLRDIGGIIIIDFVDMVLEANRELVLRRLVEALGRDRTRHQVTEITSLGLVQMTRKRVGEGLVETFSTTCEVCEGRGFIVHDHPVEDNGASASHSRHKQSQGGSSRGDDRRGRERHSDERGQQAQSDSHVGDKKVKSALTAIAAATAASSVATETEPVASAASKPKSEHTERETPKREATKRETPKREAPKREPAKREPAPSEKAVPASVNDIVLPTQHSVSKVVTRPVRRRAVVTGPLDPGKTKAASASKEQSVSKEESARAAVRDLLEK